MNFIDDIFESEPVSFIISDESPFKDSSSILKEKKNQKEN